MKKALALILALVMVLALSACGGSSAPAPTAAPSGDNSNASSNAPAEAPVDDTVYTLRFASTESEGNLRYNLLEKPIMDLITEKTNGRIQFQFFPSSTLCGSGAIIKGMQDRICDIGGDNINSYPGVYPYAEILQTPGVALGSTLEEKYANMKTYYDAYALEEAKATGIYPLFSSPALDVVLMSKFAVNSTDDYKGHTVCCNGSYAAMFTDYGAANTWVVPPEQYEALHLNVIDATVNGMGTLSAFKLFEVLDYAYYVPFSTITTSYYMSMDAYNSLPADLQAILDELVMGDEFLAINQNYISTLTENTMQAVQEGKPEFTFADLPADVSAAMQASCAANITAKIDSLNSSGLDGAGVQELINSFVK